MTKTLTNQQTRTRKLILVVQKLWKSGFIVFGIGCSKGHLISECPFDVLNFPKNQRKIWQISALRI